jgi:hypothetical protein
MFRFFPGSEKMKKIIIKTEKKQYKNLTTPIGRTIIMMMHDASNINEYGGEKWKKSTQRSRSG